MVELEGSRRSTRQWARNGGMKYVSQNYGNRDLSGYLIMHPEAKVSEGDIETIRTWSESFDEDER